MRYLKDPFLTLSFFSLYLSLLFTLRYPKGALSLVITLLGFLRVCCCTSSNITSGVPQGSVAVPLAISLLVYFRDPFLRCCHMHAELDLALCNGMYALDRFMGYTSRIYCCTSSIIGSDFAVRYEA